MRGDQRRDKRGGVKDLKDRELLEPCKRKGKLLRMTRVDGKQGVYAVYAEDDLAGVVSGISQEEREKMLRTLREIGRISTI